MGLIREETGDEGSSLRMVLSGCNLSRLGHHLGTISL